MEKKYEFEAPKYVDFTLKEVPTDAEADDWFGTLPLIADRVQDARDGTPLPYSPVKESSILEEDNTFEGDADTSAATLIIPNQNRVPAKSISKPKTRPLTVPKEFNLTKSRTEQLRQVKKSPGAIQVRLMTKHSDNLEKEGSSTRAP